MYVCRICHYPTELDDCVFEGPTGWTICVRCYSRETGTEQRMHKALRRDLAGVLNAIEINGAW